MRSLVRTSIAVMLGLFLAVAFASPTGAAQRRTLFSGDGYGSYAFAGKSVVSGKTAFVGVGCGSKAGTHVENSMQSNQEENENTGSMSTGSVETSADAIQSQSVTKTLTKATAHGVSLFKGRITASRVKAVSTTLKDGKGMRTSPTGTALTDLAVDGDVFKVEPGPNTRITLAGLGYVVLNEQFGANDGRTATLVVNGIHVYVTERNPMGIPVGTQYIVGHARSALKPTGKAAVGGQAYGHKLFERQRAQSGPSAIVYMPCTGTGGQTLTNTLSGVGHPNAFQLGTVKDTAIGRVGKSSATSLMTSSVQSVNLLNGLVTADAVKAVARGSKEGDARTFTNAGSKFVNLVVAGRPIGKETGPNTAIDLPGIGTLWLQRVIRTSNGIEVRMIELQVEEGNRFGLKPGSKLQIAVARAVVFR
jgi:hypothetical protein